MVGNADRSAGKSGFIELFVVGRSCTDKKTPTGEIERAKRYRNEYLNKGE